MLTSLLKTITKGKDLSERESAIVMEQIMEGTISDVQLAAFLAALTTKGASEREITAFARTMRKYSMHVPCTIDAFDIVGTGGGRMKTIYCSQKLILIAHPKLLYKDFNRLVCIQSKLVVRSLAAFAVSREAARRLTISAGRGILR